MSKIIKMAETRISPEDIRHNAVEQDDPEILKYFKKTAADLKAIAPKAKDFLYFTCIMMHAAEAALLDDSGNLRKTADGSDAEASWEITPTGSWIWRSNDPNIKAYKNANSDIFPEKELKKAYKKWVGKPLCLDHQSQSVDMIRGVIIDTVYDDKKKRVIALCALDKQNYPDLARKVASGVAASVSMGTAVGRAICTETGCHRVARTESEFCEHMRAKSCYGEINVDLSPIELSIVVNGADPKAKIRRVIAEADRAASYVDKQKLDDAGITVDEARSLKNDLEGKINELQSAAGDNLSLNNEGTEEVSAPYGRGVSGSKKEMDEAPEHATPEGNVPQAANTARYASDMEEVSSNVEEILKKLREKVGQLDKFINKMASVKEGSNKINEDTIMVNKKEAYFLGGGGVNEPAPHQVKYPKEEAESVRNNEDKHMQGQMDTGPVDGMHPGYDSFGESEEERKKRLLRMAEEQENRALRRQAAMDKAKDMIRQRREAYFQGGGDVNEPTPHKPKYPKEDSDSIRNKEDKQQTGEKPFPDVGKVDGLYGDDEAKKKKLLRAKLNAAFVKAANPDGSDNQEKSRWDVYAKDDSGRKLVLSATVKELAGNRAKVLYAGIATPDYGRRIIQTIREAGLEAATEIFKGSQVEETISDFVVVMPNKRTRLLSQDEWGYFLENGRVEGLELPSGGKVYSNRHLNTMKVAQVEETISDFVVVMPNGQKRLLSQDEWGYFLENGRVEGLELPSGGKVYSNRHLSQASVNAKAKTAQVAAPAMPGGQPGMGPDAAAPAAAPAGPVEDPAADPAYAGETGSAVDKMEEHVRELGNLVAEMEKGLEGLREEKGELDALPDEGGVPEGAVTASALRKQLNASITKGFKQAIANAEDVKEELELVRHVVASGADKGNKELVSALCKDASADVLKAKANIKTILESFVSYTHGNEIMAKLAQMGGQLPLPEGDAEPLTGDMMSNDDNETDLTALFGGGDDSFMAADDEDDEEEEEEKDEEKDEKDDDEEDEDDLDVDTESGSVSGEPAEVAEMLKHMSRTERDELRVKLAQKGIQFSDMLQKAHPQGGFTTDLDTKPEGDLAKVEDLKEQHDKMMDVATSAPRNVREAAEKIQMLVTAGEIDPGRDFPALIAEGLDPAAVTYWKKLWGEAKDPEASSFVGDLVKDYQTKKAAAEKKNDQVKIARAFELAYSMAERGLISRDPSSLRQQVERVMKYDDHSFDDFAKTISKLPVKQASVSTVASINGVQDNDKVITTTSTYAPSVESGSLLDEFNAAFNGRKY